MEVISIIFAIITILASAAFCIGIILIVFKQYRPKAKRILFTSFVMVIIAPTIGLQADKVAKRQADDRAIAVGFIDAADQKEAKLEGYASAEKWRADKPQIIKKRLTAIAELKASQITEQKAKAENSQR